MASYVCKFGGSSLAEAGQFRRVAEIVERDPARRFVVPSAPGRRWRDDRKVTDLLYLCHENAAQDLPFDEAFELVAERFRGIASALGLSLDLQPELTTLQMRIGEQARAGDGGAYAASRGEYLNGRILAALLDRPFVDAAEVIRFDGGGGLDRETTDALLGQRLTELGTAVMPGYYGADPTGWIHTFSRGGTDVSGALAARAVGADVYENWTDVPGVLMADPEVVDSPRYIDVITYKELRELAYMGAQVLHDEAIFPVRDAGIPVRILNTNRPGDPGTRIVPEAEPITHQGTITGIAGRKDFTVLALEKALMNAEVGFGRRVLSILEDNEISYEHTPSGIDTMSVVLSDQELEGKRERVLGELRGECAPDRIEVFGSMALIATVGRGMAYTPGIASRLFTALAKAGVNVRMIDQGSSEINIIVGVETSDFEGAVRAIYDAFVS